MLIRWFALVLVVLFWGCDDSGAGEDGPLPGDDGGGAPVDGGGGGDAGRRPGDDLGGVDGGRVGDVGADDGVDSGGEVCPRGGSGEPGVVGTSAGPVRGTRVGTVWSFLGVPFAAPPVGALRFQPPAPSACWGPEPLAAGVFSPACPQREGDSVIGEEDCLYLNVWTREAYTPASRRPVLVFVHGGGNIQGSTSDSIPFGGFLYDGKPIVDAHDAVVVTVQYRLGPLGFLAHEALSAESAHGASGNYGHLDLIAALRWVQANIAEFGGDPDRVMVFGESAGAVNTCALYASPLAAGLFSRALMQSGGCVGTPLEAAEREGARAVDLTPCAGAADVPACLRGLDAAALVAAIPGGVGFGGQAMGGASINYGPVIEGHVLPDAPLALIRRGAHNDVPFIVGSNAEEMAMTAIFPVRVQTAAQYEAVVRQSLTALGLGAQTARVLEVYPVDAFASPQDALIAVFTDAVFTCSARGIARAASAGGDANVYRYFFTRRAATARGPIAAEHGIELLYVFGSMHSIRGFTPAPEDANLSRQMMAAWVAFARDGDPNDPSLDTRWPVYDVDRDPNLVLDAPTRSEDGVRRTECDLWDSLLPQ